MVFCVFWFFSLWFCSVRSIIIKSLFNINRRTDVKVKCVIALHTLEDCFCIVFESDEELETWFRTLLQIHLGDKISEGQELKPDYGKN